MEKTYRITVTEGFIKEHLRNLKLERYNDAVESCGEEWAGAMGIYSDYYDESELEKDFQDFLKNYEAEPLN